MSAPQNLQELYNHELKDLWSANDQMHRALKKMAPKCTDPDLQKMMEKSISSIETHSETLKELVAASGEKVSKEHCKGMEGLVAEAIKHTIDEAPDKGPVLDAVVIAQYQRMTHYAIAGFGTAASFAGTLGQKKDKTQLDKLTREVYGNDEYMTKLAEMTVNIEAESA
ncbi:MAG: ferritin-like domain-containing protein [Hyphomonas sp.]